MSINEPIRSELVHTCPTCNLDLLSVELNDWQRISREVVAFTCPGCMARLRADLSTPPGSIIEVKDDGKVNQPAQPVGPHPAHNVHPVQPAAVVRGP